MYHRFGIFIIIIIFIISIRINIFRFTWSRAAHSTSPVWLETLRRSLTTFSGGEHFRLIQVVYKLYYINNKKYPYWSEYKSGNILWPKDGCFCAKKDIVRFWPRPDLNFRYHRNETIDYTSPRGGISVVNSENNSPEITSTLLIYQASWHSGQFRHVFLITISRLMDNVPNAPKKWSPKLSLSCRYKALLSALQPIYYSASHNPHHLVSASP